MTAASTFKVEVVGAGKGGGEADRDRYRRRGGRGSIKREKHGEKKPNNNVGAEHALITICSL